MTARASLSGVDTGQPLYRFAPITGEEAGTVLRWRYEDLTMLLQPVEENFADDLAAMLRPDYHYYVVRDGADDLVGFCCYGEDARVVGGEYAAPALDVGLGMRPDLVGQGRAQGYLRAILDWGEQIFAPDMFRCTVAASNLRSQRMFARAGFVTVQRFLAPGAIDLEFIVMMRLAEAAKEQAPRPG